MELTNLSERFNNNPRANEELQCCCIESACHHFAEILGLSLVSFLLAKIQTKIQNSNFESPARVRRRAGRADRLGMTCSAGRGCAGVMGVIDDDYH